MAVKQFPVVPLFQKFIQDTAKGKRLKPNGKKIKPQTVANYSFVLKHLIAYEEKENTMLQVTAGLGKNQQQLKKEITYWKNFHARFTKFLYSKKCHDNYVGFTMRILRSFFNYLKKDRLLAITDFYKSFYVLKEEINIITLMPEQLGFLINDTAFHQSLSPALQNTKNVFVFGCTVALRFSDIFNIKFTDIEYVNGSAYLSATSLKTETPTRIKLPPYALDIINHYSKTAKRRRHVFPPVSLHRFNVNVKAMAEKAGWVHHTPKYRTRSGKAVEHQVKAKQTYRFCDMVSSHTMRRTAITTMLMLGMPEHIVKKISGHAANSAAFYRYVNFVQSYLDNETEKVFEKLVGR